MNREEWDIKGPARSCLRCEKPFSDGERIFSRLEFGPEGYVRRDFCLSCAEEEKGRSAVSIWRTTYRPPRNSRPSLAPGEVAESLLRRLITREDHPDPEVTFVLAVMLERRKILVEKETTSRADGTRIRVYEHRGTGEAFVVPDPGVSLARVEEIGRRVSGMLQEEQLRLQSAEKNDSGEATTG